MRKTLETIIGLLFGVYVFGIMISTTYYTWQDIKKSDSLVRYIFVSPVVGFIDSITWPYQVYINNFSETNELTTVQVNNINLLMRAQSNFTSAITLTRQIASSKDPKDDFSKINSLMDSAKEKLIASDREVLNNIYIGLGDIAHEKLLKMVEYYQSGMQKDGDRANLARGDALLLDYNDWMSDNWDKVGKVLNQN